jgi:hypothetical protein
MGFLLFILGLVIVNALVSFALAGFVRAKGLCILASVIITELAAALVFASQGRNSAHPEDAILLPATCVVLIGTPVLVVSSVGFTFLAWRLYKRKAPNAH